LGGSSLTEEKKGEKDLGERGKYKPFEGGESEIDYGGRKKKSTQTKGKLAQGGRQLSRPAKKRRKKCCRFKFGKKVRLKIRYHASGGKRINGSLKNPGFVREGEKK